MFDASAARAPVANPGAAPKAMPATSTIAVIGLTSGTAAKASRPSAASAASAATSASSLAGGRERSYHQKAAPRVASTIANAASCQLTCRPPRAS